MAEDNNRTILCTLEFDINTYQSFVWIFILKAVIAIIIIFENIIVFLAMIQKWKMIVRQQNLYRYVLSLVAADLLNGTVLLIYSVFWIVAITYSIGIGRENPSEIFRNLVTGILSGLTFASLTSAALLNLVLRVTSTRALARAAAIKSRSDSLCFRGSWVRSQKITIALILLIWAATLIFVIVPMPEHCEDDVKHCVVSSTEMPDWKYFVQKNGTIVNETADTYDCSILRNPIKRSYVLVLNAFIILAWFLMIFCNFFTTCVKTEVQKSTTLVDGRSHLKLTRKFGFSTDTSSIFAIIISLNMTISTLPYVIFSFVTEGGSDYDHVYYGMHIDRLGVELVDMTIYVSSIVNPFIYTTMLSRLRSDILRMLKFHKHKSKKQLMKLHNGNHATAQS